MITLRGHCVGLGVQLAFMQSKSWGCLWPHPLASLPGCLLSQLNIESQYYPIVCSSHAGQLSGATATRIRLHPQSAHLHADDADLPGDQTGIARYDTAQLPAR